MFDIDNGFFVFFFFLDNVDPNLDAKAILALEAAKQLGLTPGGAALPTDEGRFNILFKII